MSDKEEPTVVHEEETFEGKKLSELFPEERSGWRGYVEWELSPERKKVAASLLATKKFTPIPGETSVRYFFIQIDQTTFRVPVRPTPEN